MVQILDPIKCMENGNRIYKKKMKKQPKNMNNPK